MSRRTPRAGDVSVSMALARDRLGPFAIGSAIASSVAPLTVVALVLSSMLAVTGLLGGPIAILAVAAILLIFVVGYLAMARHIPNAGAFYAYVAHGLGRPAGVGSSWVALLSYNAFQLCCYGGFGAVLAPLVSEWIGIEWPWWWLAGLAWLVVAVLGANEVKLSEKVMVVGVVAETVLVVTNSIAIMFTPGFAFSAAPFSLGNLWSPALGTLIVIGMTCFAGVEQSAVYIEESKNPRRTIPVATYATILIITVVYVFAFWVQISAGGPQIIGTAKAEGSDLFFNQAAVVLGAGVLDVGHFLLVTSTFAAMLAFHNAVSRYCFALGREGVLPRALGRTTVKGAPRNASIAQSALALAVGVAYAIAGWDPLTQLFYLGSTTGGLGVLLLITLTSIAVLVFFARDKHGENRWTRLVAPLVATVILLFVSYLAIDNLGTLFGVDSWTGPALVVPIAFAAVFIAGIVWALTLRATKPDVYEGIGRGTRSATASGISDIFATERTPA